MTYFYCFFYNSEYHIRRLFLFKRFNYIFYKSVDLYNYLLKNHHRRTAIGAYHIGKMYGLDEQGINDLVIAAALHDIGALYISERDDLIQMDVHNPAPHCRLGSYMLESFPPFEKISKIIYYHHWAFSEDSHWSAEKGKVPIEAYILHEADRIEILIRNDIPVLQQRQGIIDTIASLNGTLFHPDVVDAAEKVSIRDMFWLDMDHLEMENILDLGISSKMQIKMNIDLLEEFAFTISKIIDSRSEFTISHSFGVSAVTFELARMSGYTEEKCRKMRVAGLLHDIGKIAVATEIIEKNGALTENERADVQAHAYFTGLILEEMTGLEKIADWAACHHENHDGSGYPKSLSGNAITEEMDIISYADIFTALLENRPYRKSLPSEQILMIMEKEFEGKYGNHVFELLKKTYAELRKVCQNALLEGEKRYRKYEKMASVSYGVTNIDKKSGEGI